MSKIYIQGTFGAYSHLAALEIEPNAEVIPCKTFDECFLKAKSESGSIMVIPEANRITGNIGIEYLIFKYRLNIYAEHFQKIEHNLLIDSQNIYHHIGIYSYKVNVLERFVSLDQTNNEKKNKLEQLRALDNKLKINVALAKSSPIGVDTEEDYIAIKKLMEYKI